MSWPLVLGLCLLSNLVGAMMGVRAASRVYHRRLREAGHHLIILKTKGSHQGSPPV